MDARIMEDEVWNVGRMSAGIWLSIDCSRGICCYLAILLSAIAIGCREADAPKTAGGEVTADSFFVRQLSTGVTHRRVMTDGRHIANVISIELKSNARLLGAKALNRYDGLESVRDICQRARGMSDDTLLAAANASFWKATLDSPIGLTIVNGEVIEMSGYKAWSSLMLFDDGTAAIDQMTLRGELQWRKTRCAVEAINHRGSLQGIVAYNHYYGDLAPKGSRQSDSAIIAAVLGKRVRAGLGDDTEAPGIDTAELIRSYRAARKLEDREYPLLKIACRPAMHQSGRGHQYHLDDTMRLVVTRIDTGAVPIPDDGYLLSLGSQRKNLSGVRIGDTMRLCYNVLPRQPKPLRDLFTGTPRLVREGTPEPEQEREGSKATRFVEGALARTAVGISRGNDSLFLVTIDSPNPADSTTGMTLAELARFMASIGAWQAMNFDGGASTTLVVDGRTISRQGGAPFNRRISTAFLVVKKRDDSPVKH